MSFNPGIELVVEANEGYWRKTPAVKRLVFKSVPDEATRLAMLKRAEADVAYSIRGPNAEEVKRTAGLTLKPTFPTFTEWIVFTEQWDSKSPWADQRVRLAANLAIDRKTINEAEYLGHGKLAFSHDSPRLRVLTGRRPAYPFDPAKAKQLLAEAGYPKGFDAVEVATDAVYAPEAEAVINGFQAVGIRARLRPMERAGFYKADQEKKFKHLVRVGSAAAGNALDPHRGVRDLRPGSARTAATRTSTRSSAIRRPRWTRSVARRCCTRSSSSCTSARCSRRSSSRRC